MKSNVRKVKKYRHYSEEFKRQLVSEFESGQFSVLQLTKLHGVQEQLIYNWIYKYSNFSDKGYRIVEHKHSSSKKLKTLQAENQQLKAKVGEKQILIEYLEKLIEVAGEELNIDIKKNFDTPQSGSSKRTTRR